VYKTLVQTIGLGGLTQSVGKYIFDKLLGSTENSAPERGAEEAKQIINIFSARN
jgi:hypothetical protein